MSTEIDFDENDFNESYDFIKNYFKDVNVKITTEDFDNALESISDDMKTGTINFDQNIFKTNALLIKNNIKFKEFDANHIEIASKFAKEFEVMKKKVFSNPDEIMKKSSTLRQYIELLTGRGLKDLLEVSKELILFIFTILIVAHLRIRSFMNSCFLYPSNREKHPFVFYEMNKSEQNNLLSILNVDYDTEVEPVFNNVPITINPDGTANDKDNQKINELCSNLEFKMVRKETAIDNAMKVATDLFGSLNATDDEMNKETNNMNSAINDNKYIKAQKEILKGIYGESDLEKKQKMNKYATMFIRQHKEKCKNELTIYSLITYILLYNIQNINEFIGGIHNGIGGSITSSNHYILFIIVTLFIFNLFKSNVKLGVKIMKRFINNYFSSMDDSNMNMFVLEFLSIFLAPFLTVFLILAVIIYPMTLFNSMVGYLNYMSYTSLLTTKMVGFIGIIYSILALIIYFMMLLSSVFPELLKKIVKEMKIIFRVIGRFIKGKGAKGKGKGKGKGKSKGKGQEGFSGKGKGKGKGQAASPCEPASDSGPFNMAKLLGLIILAILTLFTLIPFIIPFVSTFISSASIANGITFDSIKYMNSSLCSIMDYKKIIKYIFIFIILYKIKDRYKYGSKKTRMIAIGVYSIFILLFTLVEMTIGPTVRYFNRLQCNVETNNEKN
uniref:Uncharacterized protein n=1 Tax=Florenciella sp. virus SA2 TaxID=3240092 RepID=A0AB39JFD6_9VIRU